MRASSLLLRSATAGHDDPPGWAALQRDGWFVPLAPALVGGGSLAVATLARLERRLLARLPWPRVALEASDGQALVNLALHHGLDAARRGAVALGAGFRDDPAPGRGLFQLQLYRRLDAAVVADAGERPVLDPGAALTGALAALGVGDLALEEVDDERRWLATVRPADTPVELLRVRRAPLSEGSGAPDVWLASLDLHAALGVLAERHVDERGLAWPAALAPFDVGLLAVDPAGRNLLEKLAPELSAAGLAVLLDDRGRAPGAARDELIAWGLPWLVMAGPRAEQGELLLQARAGGPPRRVTPAELPALLGVADDRDALRRRVLA